MEHCDRIECVWTTTFIDFFLEKLLARNYIPDCWRLFSMLRLKSKELLNIPGSSSTSTSATVVVVVVHDVVVSTSTSTTSSVDLLSLSFVDLLSFAFDDFVGAFDFFFFLDFSFSASEANPKGCWQKIQLHRKI